MILAKHARSTQHPEVFTPFYFLLCYTNTSNFYISDDMTELCAYA